jgi:predicted amidophosphoribosyltransferase
MAHCSICDKFSGKDSVHPGCVPVCDHSELSWDGDRLFCDDCEADVTPGPGDACPKCDGEGWYGDGNYCECAKGKAYSAEVYAQFAYMIPMVKRAVAAERAGDHEEYERIRMEAIR